MEDREPKPSAPERPDTDMEEDAEVADVGMSGVTIEQEIGRAEDEPRIDEEYLKGLTDHQLEILHGERVRRKEEAIKNGQQIVRAQEDLKARKERGENIDPELEAEYAYKYDAMEKSAKENSDIVRLVVAAIDRRDRLKAENGIHVVEVEHHQDGSDRRLEGGNDNHKHCIICNKAGHDYTSCPTTRAIAPEFNARVVPARRVGEIPYASWGGAQQQVLPPMQGVQQQVLPPIQQAGVYYYPTQSAFHAPMQARQQASFEPQAQVVYAPLRERRAAPIDERGAPKIDVSKPPPVIGKKQGIIGHEAPTVVGKRVDYPSGMVTPGRYYEPPDTATGQPFFVTETNPPRLIGVPYGHHNVSYVNNPKGGSSYIKEFYTSEPKSDKASRENDARVMARRLMGDDATDEELKAASNMLTSFVENFKGAKGERRNTHEVKKVEKSFDQYTDRSLKKEIDFDDLEYQIACGFYPKLNTLLPKSFYTISPSAAAACMHSLCTSIMTDFRKPEAIRRYFAEQRDDINLVQADEHSKEVFIRELRIRQHDDERPMTAAQTQFNVKCPRMGAYTNVIREDLERIRHAKLSEWKMYSTDQKFNGLWALNVAHSVIDNSYNEEGAYRVLTQIFTGEPLDTINLVWNAEHMGKDFPHVWSELITLLSGACAYAMHKNGDKDIEKLLNPPPHDGIVKRIFDLRKARKNHNQAQGLFADEREANITNEHRVDVLGYVFDYYREYYPQVERTYWEDLKRKKDIKRDDPSFRFDPNVVLRTAVTKIITPKTAWTHPARKRNSAGGSGGKIPGGRNPYIDSRYVSENPDGGPDHKLQAIEYKAPRASRPPVQGDRTVRGILTRSGQSPRAVSPALAPISEDLRERLKQTDFRQRCYLCKTKGHDYPRCSLYPDMIPTGPECRECGGFHGFAACQSKNAHIDVKTVIEAEAMDLDDAIAAERQAADPEYPSQDRSMTSEELKARENAL